jgi:hypothetical protein
MERERPAFCGDITYSVYPQSRITDICRKVGQPFEGEAAPCKLVCWALGSCVMIESGRKMHAHRLATFLLGAWIAVGLFMALVATQNFHAVDRLLAAPAPEAAERIQTLGGKDAARVFLRYHSSELNRFYFATWERAQIVLGLALLLLLSRGGMTDRLLCVAMLAIVLAGRWWLTPEITQVGRAIDWIPQAASDPQRTYFWKLHGIYSSCEVAKQLLGLALAIHLIKKGINPGQYTQTPIS